MTMRNECIISGCTDDGPAMHLSIMVNTETDFDVPCPDARRRWLP